jgi:hypothetical protein
MDQKELKEAIFDMFRKSKETSQEPSKPQYKRIDSMLGGKMNLTANDFTQLDPNSDPEKLKDAFKTAYLRGNTDSRTSLKTLLDTAPYNEMKDEVAKIEAARGTANTNPNRQFGASNQPTVNRSGGGFLREQNNFKQNTMTQEQLKLQKRAGILTESEYKAKLEKISKPLNESIGGVVSLGFVGSTKDPIDYFFGKRYLNEAETAQAIAAGENIEAVVKKELADDIAELSNEEKAKLKAELEAELAKLGVTSASDVKDVVSKLDESLFEAEGDIKQQVAGALSDIGGGLMKSMLVPLIPLIVGKVTGTGFGGGLAITAGVAGSLIAIAKLLGAEKTNEVKKKTELNEASFTDMMEPEAKEMYREYIQKIDIFGDREIQDHKALDMALKSDPRFNKIRQKQLLQRALGWYITHAQEMER